MLEVDVSFIEEKDSALALHDLEDLIQLGF